MRIFYTLVEDLVTDDANTPLKCSIGLSLEQLFRLQSSGLT